LTVHLPEQASERLARASTPPTTRTPGASQPELSSPHREPDRGVGFPCPPPKPASPAFPQARNTLPAPWSLAQESLGSSTLPGPDSQHRGEVRMLGPVPTVGHDLVIRRDGATGNDFFEPASIDVGNNIVGHDLIFTGNSAESEGGYLEVSDNIVGRDA